MTYNVFTETLSLAQSIRLINIRTRAIAECRPPPRQNCSGSEVRIWSPG